MIDDDISMTTMGQHIPITKLGKLSLSYFMTIGCWRTAMSIGR
jgi:hypothetical protein